MDDQNPPESNSAPRVSEEQNREIITEPTSHYDAGLPWNSQQVEVELLAAYAADSETDLLKVLKDNSFLFYDLFSRKWGIQPVFRELNFGTKFRCDFAWLNDNSSGPEWVLVEVEKPQMKLFRSDGKPTTYLNNAIEQIKSWDRYFEEHNGEARRIFGAVAQFRFILVAGSGEDWRAHDAQKWRLYNQTHSNIEIRSMDTFLKSLNVLKEYPGEMWSFTEHPLTLPPANLEGYWQNDSYLNHWRQIIN